MAIDCGKSGYNGKKDGSFAFYCIRLRLTGFSIFRSISQVIFWVSRQLFVFLLYFRIRFLVGLFKI
jgi:hypothetical protein